MATADDANCRLFSAGGAVRSATAVFCDVCAWPVRVLGVGFTRLLPA